MKYVSFFSIFMLFCLLLGCIGGCNRKEEFSSEYYTLSASSVSELAGSSNKETVSNGKQTGTVISETESVLSSDRKTSSISDNIIDADELFEHDDEDVISALSKIVPSHSSQTTNTSSKVNNSSNSQSSEENVTVDSEPQDIEESLESTETSSHTTEISSSDVSSKKIDYDPISGWSPIMP